MRRRLLAVLVAAAVPLGCGGQSSTTKTTGTTPRTSPVVVEGRLVPIGGGRSLYLDCAGTGRPTVILEAGFGGNTNNWSTVQPALARTTRTCTYDRAGLGNSVARPGVHDAADEIADLRGLVAAAHLPPPYVVVGHSYGGLLARLFARAHPGAVRGLVLVDAVGRNQDRRTLAVWPPSKAPALRREITSPVDEGVDLAAGERLGARVTTLGGLPLAVVTAGRHADEWGDLPAPLPRRLDRLWTAMQDELAQLSGDHVHVVAQHSDHFVQSIDGQPEVVTRAANAVVAAVRGGARLPACRSLFSGDGVRCRP